MDPVASRSPASAADAAPDPVQSRRDLAVVIPTPPGAPADAEAPPLGRLLVERRATRPQDITLAVIQQGEGDERPIGEILVDHGATTAAQVVEALEHQAASKRAAAGTTVRVDTALLDALEQLVAELAEARDQVLAQVDGEDTAAVRLHRVCAALQETISTIRADHPPGGRDAGS